MYIAKYDPFREVRSLQDEVNRLFTACLSAWYPKVDIFAKTIDASMAANA
ncbi:MAG: hypothetical protein ABIO36_09810 [Pyrinomonadaceae bacterium]